MVSVERPTSGSNHGRVINFLYTIANWATEILRLLAQVKMMRAARGLIPPPPKKILYFLSQILHFTHIFERNKTS
jgi:hypothetical protein